MTEPHVFIMVWLLTMVAMICFYDTYIVIYWENGLKIYLERRRKMAKEGKNPSRRIKEMLSQRKLNPKNWLVIREEADFLDIKNKESGCVRRLAK